MLTTIPPTLHSPGGRRTPAPGSPQHTLAAAAAAAAPAAASLVNFQAADVHWLLDQNEEVLETSE